jgi:O-antigen/teichoic acid export membrane protein
VTDTQGTSKGARAPGFARNAAANWAAFIYVAAISFFLSPFIVHKLGNEAYGVWSLLVSVVGYLGLLDFGVRGAVTRYVAKNHAKRDADQNTSIVSAAMLLYSVLGAIAIIISGIVAVALPKVFNIPEHLLHDSQLVLVVSGVTVAVTLVGAVFGGVVTGLERFDINSGLEILVTTVRSIAVVLALKAGYGLVALGIIHLAGSIINGTGSWIATRKLYPELHFRFRIPLLPHIKTILSFSVFLSAIHIMGVLVYYSDALVIAAFMPVSAVTYFAIAGNLCDYAYKVAGSLSKMMMPRVSALTSVGSDHVHDVVVGMARVATLATAPIASIFWFRGESFINLWMGTDYGPVSGKVLMILSFLVWLGGARFVAVSSIMGVSKHRYLIPALAFEAISNLLLSIALVRPYGITGVALGTIIPSMLVTLFLIPRYLKISIGIQKKHFYLKAWLIPTVACLPYVATNILLEKYWPASNLAIFFLQVILTLPIVAITAYRICFDENERKQINGTFRSFFKMPKRQGISQ